MACNTFRKISDKSIHIVFAKHCNQVSHFASYRRNLIFLFKQNIIMYINCLGGEINLLKLILIKVLLLLLYLWHL